MACLFFFLTGSYTEQNILIMMTSNRLIFIFVDCAIVSYLRTPRQARPIDSDPPLPAVPLPTPLLPLQSPKSYWQQIWASTGRALHGNQLQADLSWLHDLQYCIQRKQGSLGLSYKAAELTVICKYTKCPLHTDEQLPLPWGDASRPKVGSS